MNCSTPDAHYSGETVPAPKQSKPVTIGEQMDRRIETARKNVEALCITKAKLEALNVLDHPIDLYQDILF